jgi:tellurite resistance-related uncharacterized protein
MVIVVDHFSISESKQRINSAMEATVSKLPDTVSAYKRTSTFTKSTVPKGLLARHNTKKDTWGLIVVETGSLSYVIFNESESDVSTVLSPGQPGVIEPQIFHKVKLLTDNTTFYVEFYAKDIKDIGVPKFIKESDVNSVERSDSTMETIRGFLIQMICVGILAIFVGFLLIQVSEIKQSASYNNKIDE